MSLRNYIFTMIAGTFIAFFGLVKLLLTVRPEEARLKEFVLFYLLCFLALVGFFSLIGLFIRIRLCHRRELVIREVKHSFRHALLFAGVAVSAFGFSKHAKFEWWTSFVLILVASLIEIVTLLIQRSRRG